MSIESLKKQYESLLDTGQYELSKAEFNELNTMHKDKFHKNIKRDCKSCGARGLRAVFGEQETVKIKQTFPKHEPSILSAKSETYGELGDMSSKQYFNNLQNLIRQAVRKQKETIESALHYNCFNGAYVFALQRNDIDTIGYDTRAVSKDYKEFLKTQGTIKAKGSITKVEPKEQDIDLLVYLTGEQEELDALIKKYSPKFVHTHLELDNPIKIIPTLPEGKLYKIK